MQNRSIEGKDVNNAEEKNSVYTKIPVLKGIMDTNNKVLKILTALSLLMPLHAAAEEEPGPRSIRNTRC